MCGKKHSRLTLGGYPGVSGGRASLRLFQNTTSKWQVGEQGRRSLALLLERPHGVDGDYA